MRIGRRGVVLMVLRHGGRPAQAVELPRWTLILASLSMGLLLLMFGYLGFHMQGVLGVRGRSAQWEAATVREHWLAFEKAAKTMRLLTYKDLRQQAALARALRLGLGHRAAASTLLRGQVERHWLREVGQSAPLPGTLNWPVPSGWYVRGYGSGEEGYHLAVDIMGGQGDDVVAAASGLVGYAGDTVRGYGNMVMLIHAGGFITAYAHNQNIHVMPGERVKRGQTIATLGNTGISRGPHVHFEFMYDGRNCDPLPLFRPGVRHRAGHLGEVLPAVWSSSAQPEAIACGKRRRHPQSRWYAKSEELPDF